MLPARLSIMDKTVELVSDAYEVLAMAEQIATQQAAE